MWVQVVQELHAAGEQDLQHELSFLLASTEFEMFCRLFEEYSGTQGLVGGLEDEEGGKLEQPEWA